MDGPQFVVVEARCHVEHVFRYPFQVFSGEIPAQSDLWVPNALLLCLLCGFEYSDSSVNQKRKLTLNRYFVCSPEEFCEFFFVFASEFCIEKWRGFLVNFFCSPFPTKRSTKILKKFGKNSEQNSGQNSGRKFEKSGKFSFCNFSDLMNRKVGKSAFPSLYRVSKTRVCLMRKIQVLRCCFFWVFYREDTGIEKSENVSIFDFLSF